MPRPHVTATRFGVANDPCYSPGLEGDFELMSHDVDDDEDDIEFEADDRHCGVRAGFDPEAA